jgi:ABC-type phosphate transport system permease subunit
MSADSLPNSAKIAMGLQALLTCLVFFMWGAWAAWGRLPNSLEASGIVFCPVLLLCIFATYGLWKGMLFGWAAALLGNVATSLILVLTAGPLSIFPAGFLVFLLTARVRGFYLRNYYE